MAAAAHKDNLAEDIAVRADTAAAEYTAALAPADSWLANTAEKYNLLRSFRP